MPDDTTLLLRRAVSLRHTPGARAFFAALLAALSAGTDDRDEVCRVVVAGCVAERLVAASVSDWLRGLVAGSGIDERRVLAGATAVETALREVGRRPLPLRRAARSQARLRDAVTEAFGAPPR